MGSKNSGQRIQRHGRILVAGVTLLAPGLAIWVILGRLLRRRGMKYALMGFSIVGNVIFLGVLLAAYSDSGGGKDSAEHLDALRGVPPEGLRWRGAGPLYLAELAITDTQDPSAISDTILVTFEGCILAAFEFDDGFVALSDSQLYDLACRPRVSLDVRNGAAVYSVYEDGSDPIYSTVDEDADGMPDRKVNWITNESFVRSGAIAWRKVNQRQPSATETGPG